MSGGRIQRGRCIEGFQRNFKSQIAENEAYLTLASGGAKSSVLPYPAVYARDSLTWPESARPPLQLPYAAMSPSVSKFDARFARFRAATRKETPCLTLAIWALDWPCSRLWRSTPKP
jgi:hypothetical protein